MILPNIFTSEVSEDVISRINKLKPDTEPEWGKMSVDQMLAHCNVTYEMVYTDKHKKPNWFMRQILKMFVKSGVTNTTPYKKNIRTAPQFKITDKKKFEEEKERLISYVRRTSELGEEHFEGKESLSFGSLTKEEWNNMFYKHLDHHLRQFGV